MEITSSEAATSRDGAPRRARRLHELDGLRAIAIGLVVMHHSLTGSIQQALAARGLARVGDYVSFVTRSGVELFFVISAVVLLKPYLVGNRRFDGRRFLQRRVQRLWPPYAASLIFAGFVVYEAAQWPTWYSREIVPPFHLHVLLLQSLIVNFGWTTYNGAWWSLTPEVGFYLLVPAIIAITMLPRARTQAVNILLAVTVVVSLAASATMSPGVSSATAVVALFLTYLPTFLIGAYIAQHDLSGTVGITAFFVGVVYSVVAFLWPAINIHLAFGVVYGGVAVTAMTGKGRLRSLLSRYPLVWLGERSYSLFLVHFSVFYLTDHLASFVFPDRSGAYVIVTRMVGLPLSLLVAMLLFWFVERPFARGLSTGEAFLPRATVMPISRLEALSSTS